MNKEQLITKIATDVEISKAQAKLSLESFLDAVKKSLKKGEKVALVGFGTFSVSKRKARNGRNPATNQVIKIPAKNVIKFKAGKEFTGVVNKKK
ncbi:MAG TPA: HU family DNA-binding protein [Ignavibacteria bacterium]|jgi:DNA-binding protein HU-beta|nr:HU family DNA-binding protein [Ignavibacteria bacterium]